MTKAEKKQAKENILTLSKQALQISGYDVRQFTDGGFLVRVARPTDNGPTYFRVSVAEQQ